MTPSSTRILTVALAVSACAVTGYSVHRYFYAGEVDDSHVFESGTTTVAVTQKTATVDARTGKVISSETRAPDIDVEQTKRDLDEIERLRLQGKRELAGIVQFEVGGSLFTTHKYRYRLADGREKMMGESGDTPDNPTVMKRVNISEVYRLRREGAGVDLEPETRNVKGRPFVFRRYRVTQSNGVRVVLSTGKPVE